MRGLLLHATLCVVALSIPGHAQVPDTGRVSDPPQSLALDGVVARHGVTGDIHRYTVDLDVDTFFEVTASQDAAELGLALVGPDGAQLMSLDMPSLSPLSERLMFIAPRAGTYRIDVSLFRRGERNPPDHQYTLRVITSRSANERDRRRDRCFTTTAQAERTARHGKSVSDLGKAIEMLKQAATCWDTESDVDPHIATLTSLAALAGLFSEFRLDSAAAFERLIDLLRATGRADLELSSLEDLTVEYNDDGRFDRSRQTAIEMQRLAARLGNRAKEGRAYQRLAFAEYSLGNYDSARRAALSFFDIANEVKDAELVAAAHLQLGRIDEVAGDYEAALARYEQGLRAGPNDRYVIPVLTNAIGFLHLRRGEYDAAARRFDERLAMIPRFVQRDQEALARVGLGDVRSARGDREGAAQMYTAAANALRRGVPTQRCIAIQRLGRQALTEGRLEEAVGHFAEMLDIGLKVGNLPCEAEARAGVADAAFRRGDLDAADAAALQVIQIAEQFREATPSLESRALGFGALAPAFERAVEINMHRGERGDDKAAARALVLNERALARGLLDHISLAAGDRPGPATDALAADRRQLREQWRVRVAQFQVATQMTGDRDRAETLRQEMTALDLKLRDLEARVDLADPRRARLIRPQVLELEAMQGLLDTDTTLLEYALGEHESYLWVVTSKTMHAFRLAPRAEIEAVAHGVYTDLTTSTAAVQPAAEWRRRALSRLVLAPAAAMLTGGRLVVVASGALSLVPFAVLPLEREPMDGSLLLSRFEIVHVPSATTLAAMRALTERRSRPSKHTVVFADPIFETADPRVSGPAAVTGKPSRQAESRSLKDARPAESAAARTLTSLGASFPRLPFSRGEANALNALAPGQVTTFLDGRATRERTLGQSLSEYRFIHFATHGVVHPEVPSLSSIVLSFVDSSGAKLDPFLTLPDIYEMRLNADIVVLSACSTAEGRQIPGEGPIGLARGFMFAGAPRVVASFWRVNDIATAELMKRFYRGILVEGLTAAGALRTAQQQVAAIPKWASPYYWAPFVLQGDWR